MRCLHKHQLIAPACFNSAMTSTGWDVTLMAVHTMTFSQQQEAVNSSKVSAGIDTKWIYTEAKDSHLSEPDLQDLLIQCGQIQQYHKELSWDSLTKVNKVTFLDCLLLLCLCCCAVRMMSTLRLWIIALSGCFFTVCGIAFSGIYSLHKTFPVEADDGWLPGSDYPEDRWTGVTAQMKHSKCNDVCVILGVSWGHMLMCVMCIISCVGVT